MQSLLNLISTWLSLLFFSSLIGVSMSQEPFDCPSENVSFEMITGYVYSAPADMLDSQPGTLMLTDCIDTCRKNESCRAINYETGLCVLFSSNADTGGELSVSQFPVFTSYVQKNCLSSASKCGEAAWSFERVMNYAMDAEVLKRGQVETRQACMDLCLAETSFKCRSATYNVETGDCQLMSHDRHTLAGKPQFTPTEGVDYLEINCNLGEPRKLCIYDRVVGKILKTVDSVYQAIATKEDCEDLCNNAPFRCHSYDFSDTGDNVCRLSHHSAHSLTQIEEPYLAIEEATTYELSGCYNVSIDCHSGDMTAYVMTSSVFNGKIYAKGSPVTCMVDVDNQLEFSITMGYNDLECGVTRESAGVYKNDVIIQHHDRIVTSDDLGMALTCQYDLTNQSVSNTVDLEVTGEITPALYEEAVVDSPNVIMRVEDARGEDTKAAVVGDPLSMIFEIIDAENSPYEIFVRDLVAVDGATDTELVLIDSRGCPVDTSIMGELRRDEDQNKTLISSFDAFRFPTSQVVQFRAMVTPCMPTCEPVQCDVMDYTGQSKTVESYGRKKRWTEPLSIHRQKRMSDPEEVLVIKTLRILDKPRMQKKTDYDPELESDLSNNDIKARDSFDESFDSIDFDRDGLRCLNESGLIAGGVIFLTIQIMILLVWTFIWKKKRQLQSKDVILPSEMCSSSTDSLSYIYDTGIPRRME